MPSYRFGPFVVDAAAYRVSRDGSPLELTPKLLDLLLHLVEHAGSLVTKEQLLDALWPDANVTENALTQAVSELRQAIGDDASAPVYIRTVARRGYRFVATVEMIGTEAAAAQTRAGTTSSPAAAPPAIAVLDFTNVNADPESAWLSAGIADTVSTDLRGSGSFRVVDRWQIAETAHRTGGSVGRLATELHVAFVVVGSFQRSGDTVRITARILDIAGGDAIADAKVDGRLDEIFELQDQVAQQLTADMSGGGRADRRRPAPRDTSSLEAYRAATEGWLLLETLDIREIPRATSRFQAAIAADRRYTLAYTGLANAEIIAYETTRSENAPGRDFLDAAIEHARTAVALDDQLAESHATLAFVLVSAWQTDEARRAAARAVALQPESWRHLFRLGHASWGEDRLRASTRTLELFPDFAFAHFQSAMVHVARGNLRDAETLLRQGAAVQDRQIGRGDRYPALGLHWLLALVRLADNDVDEALRELERERALAAPHRLYGREYMMSVDLARGACMLRLERHADAVECFERALALYPHHAQSNLGLAVALDACGSAASARAARTRAMSAVDVLVATRPFEAAAARAAILAADGDVAQAADVLGGSLEMAPRGFALWSLPIDPQLTQVIKTQELTPVLTRLAERAR